MDNENLLPQPKINKQEEPTITLPLKTFLDILWGYKFQGGDYREKAYPQDEVIAALEALPPEIANKYFKIIRSRPGVERVGEPVVWSSHEWKASGEKYYADKERANQENYAGDKLTEFLRNKFPAMDKEFIRTMALQVVTNKTYDTLLMMGLTTAELDDIKNGKYE